VKREYEKLFTWEEIMRKFNSYEEINTNIHYYAPREELIELGYNHLLGEKLDYGGHYITVWAPRQTGKTWVMRQVIRRLKQRGDFEVAIVAMQSAKTAKSEPEVFDRFITQLRIGFGRDFPDITSWGDLTALFSSTYFDKPVILIVDEFDAMGDEFINKFANEFRSIYISRNNEVDIPSGEKRYLLHGLALVGVRAVLGIESSSGSPFNVQRSMHVPNLTFDEVEAMFKWYEQESGQPVEDQIIERLYSVTRGQPGLIGWFGELLTERYNPAPPMGKAPPFIPPNGGEIGGAIGEDVWKLVWLKARFVEPNNTVMNLISKAREPEYLEFLMQLFTQADVPFSFDDLLHNHLYMHGIISTETVEYPNGELAEICRFSSPFIQTRIYHALRRDIVNNTRLPLAIKAGDTLADVFDHLDLPALLQRYKDYLVRLKAAGHDPWKQQPRRKTDLQLSEAVGHFHLYAWLQSAARRCIISPEFPTGNGKVDLHIRYETKQGIIEIKSFVDNYQLSIDKKKAAQYASSMGLDNITMAVFVPVLDEGVLTELSGVETIGGVEVTVVAIGWM
jgi:hypothetical protein